MTVTAAFDGEDVPVRIRYETADGTATDPDDQGADGVPDADITITNTSDGTDVIAAVAMTHEATGEFEYVWDTDVDAPHPGLYRVSITAEFGGETKITRDTIRLQ